MERTQGPKLDEVKRLKSDYDQLVQHVRTELLEQIDQAITQLRELGYNFTLQESIQTARGNGRRSVTPGVQLRPTPSANYDAGKKCRVCSAAGHDGRAHRRQRGGRKPFTFDELTQLGLRPPANA